MIFVDADVAGLGILRSADIKFWGLTPEFDVTFRSANIKLLGLTPEFNGRG